MNDAERDCCLKISTNLVALKLREVLLSSFPVVSAFTALERRAHVKKTNESIFISPTQIARELVSVKVRGKNSGTF